MTITRKAMSSMHTELRKQGLGLTGIALERLYYDVVNTINALASSVGSEYKEQDIKTVLTETLPQDIMYALNNMDPEVRNTILKEVMILMK